MKKAATLKKAFSLILAFSLLCALCVTALADDTATVETENFIFTLHNVVGKHQETIVPDEGWIDWFTMSDEPIVVDVYDVIPETVLPVTTQIDVKVKTPGHSAWVVEFSYSDKYRNPDNYLEMLPVEGGCRVSMAAEIVEGVSGDFTETMYGGTENFYSLSIGGECVYYSFVKDTPSSWAEKEVNEAIEAGIVPNYLQYSYSQNVSRVNVAEVFIRLIENASGKDAMDLIEEKGLSYDKSAFTDTWDDYVFMLNALGIVKGTGDGKFMPDASFTRGQVVAMLNRVARLLGVDTEGYTHSFTDTKGHWSDSELGWATANGIVKGYSEDKFAPDDEITTEQAIAFSDAV